MSKLKGLLLTEGLHGMVSQVEGLARALDLEYFHEKIELNSFWNLIPPKLSPVSKFVFKDKIEKDFDVIISCGRKSVIPSIYLKKNSVKKVYNIHIQDPKVSLNNFDFIIAPEHDGLSGNNVLTTKGAIHYISKEEIINSKNYLINKFQLNDYFNEEKLVAIIFTLLALSNIVLNVVLFDLYELWGIVYSTLITYSLFLVIVAHDL